MNDRSTEVTRIRPRAAEAPTTAARSTGTLAPDLMAQSASRLRTLALLYAFTFVAADFFPPLLSAETTRAFFSVAVNWVPGVISIAAALVVAFIASRKDVPLTVVMNVGLVFGIVSCYGIATAEYLNPMRLDMGGWIGLSWVAVWAPLFTVVVPTRPMKAGLTALVSLSAAPIVMAFMIFSGRTTLRMSVDVFLIYVTLPYLLVSIMAYVSARVVYSLGKAVTDARELGSYKLVEKLGQGGMGEVWRARHRLLARPAAVKLIRASAVNGSGTASEAVTRFEREAQVTAGLSSPHTVQLFDFGVADDGTFYYVMELLNGLDLETMVKRHGPLPPERVVHLLRQACHSLAEAESLRLVHRDIKPANLFVCLLGGDYDFVKVLDFGIAKRARDTRANQTINLTRENVLPGTPAYIAPEQATGAFQVDARADIYAIGCVAYFLLTGQLVFTAETPMGVVMHHAQTEPTPPSRRSELPIPEDLDRLVMDCLPKDPAKRPQTARALNRRLGEIRLEHAWTDERARTWWETHDPEMVRPPAPRA